MPQMGAVEFASVLAAAAPFGDRLRGRYFAPTGEPDPAVLAAWARAAGADRTDLLDAALVLLGLTQAQLAAGLAPVRLRGAESLVATAGMATIPEELLPSWGLALRDFLHAVGSAPLDGWHVPVGPIFTDVWVRACSAALVLMDDAVAEWVVPLEDKARRDLAMSLARRIAYATRRAMEPEALVATAAGLVLAVVAAACYAVFRNRVQGLISELEGASSHVMGLLAASYQRRREPGRAEDEF